jgi:hypothetical protein
VALHFPHSFNMDFSRPSGGGVFREISPPPRSASSAPKARQRAYARWFKMFHFEQNWRGTPFAAG